MSAISTADFLEDPARLDESTRLILAGKRLKLPAWFIEPHPRDGGPGGSGL